MFCLIDGRKLNPKFQNGTVLSHFEKAILIFIGVLLPDPDDDDDCKLEDDEIARRLRLDPRTFSIAYAFPYNTGYVVCS